MFFIVISTVDKKISSRGVIAVLPDDTTHEAAGLKFNSRWFPDGNEADQIVTSTYLPNRMDLTRRMKVSNAEMAKQTIAVRLRMDSTILGVALR